MAGPLGCPVPGEITVVSVAKKAVEQNVDMKVWREKFTSDNPDDRDFFEGFAWTGLLEAAHAEMWPR